MKKIFIFLVLVMGFCFFNVDSYIGKNQTIFGTLQECQAQSTTLGPDEYYVSSWIVTNDGSTDDNENPNEGNMHKAVAVYTKNNEYATWDEIQEGFKNVTNVLNSVVTSKNSIFEGYKKEGSCSLVYTGWINFGENKYWADKLSVYPYKKIFEEHFLLKKEMQENFNCLTPIDGASNVCTSKNCTFRLRYDLDGSNYYLYFMGINNKTTTLVSSTQSEVVPSTQSEVVPSTTNQLTVPPGLSDLNRLGDTNVQKFIGRLIKLSMGGIGMISFVMFVYGGLMWMLSAGNVEKTKKARDTIVWAALAVVVIMASYAIVSFVFELF